MRKNNRMLAVGALSKRIWLARRSYFRPMALAFEWFDFIAATSGASVIGVDPRLP